MLFSTSYKNDGGIKNGTLGTLNLPVSVILFPRSLSYSQYRTYSQYFLGRYAVKFAKP